MRITCPNCGAQYEVDDALIPEAGRDVQCSNCGKGWFQAKHEEPAAAVAQDEIETEEHADDIRPEPDFEATEPENEPPVTENTFGDLEDDAEEDEPADVDAMAPSDLVDETAEDDLSAEVEDEEPEPSHAYAEAPETVDVIEPPEVENVEEAHAQPVEEQDAAEPEAIEDEEDEAPPQAQTPRSTDEAVLAVLREEAEREIAARRNEDASGLETQPDLGLEESSDHRAAPVAEAAAASAAVASGARRDLLPDIDEINSTLRSDADREPEADHDTDMDAVVHERRKGFRVGFTLMILIAVAMIGLYVGSAAIIDAVPSVEPFVISYVDWANGVRDWFDGMLEEGVAQLSE